MHQKSQLMLEDFATRDGHLVHLVGLVGDAKRANARVHVGQGIELLAAPRT